jgi:hypothetical protein
VDENEMHEVAELPVLGGIAVCLRWLEELIVLVSGPMLTAGLGIGLVALLSDGALLVSAPWLLYAWAISQTVGVDGQLVGAWFRVSVAVSRKRWGAVVGFAILGLLLAYVAYVATLVFATQQAYRLTTAQALAHLGMDATSWLWQRAAISVLLVCLSGYLRYRAPRHDARSLEQRKRAIQEQMELDALKAQQRQQKVVGALGMVRQAAQAAREAVATQAAPAPGSQPEILPEREPEPGVDGEVSVAPAAPLAYADRPALPMAWPRVEASAEPTSPNGHRATSTRRDR